MERYINIQ
jgi:hypothetical protein